MSFIKFKNSYEKVNLFNMPHISNNGFANILTGIR